LTEYDDVIKHCSGGASRLSLAPHLLGPALVTGAGVWR